MKDHLLYLARRDVACTADMALAIKTVRAAFKAQAQGKAVMPAKVYLDLPKGDFRAMPAALESPGRCGLKWVNVHPDNRKQGLPSVMAVVIINEPKTGQPLAIMDGGYITQLRTAAAAAVAAQTLARKNANIAALLGCGAQAFSQLEALLAVRKLKQVRVWGFVRGEADQFCRTHQKSFSQTELIPQTDIKTAVADVDIVVTLTPSRKALVQENWIAPGTHINAMGADGPGKQELDPKLLKKSVLVVDELTQSIHGGEINKAYSKGLISRRDIHATLGEVLLGKRSGRTKAPQITVFDSTGLATHDIALGHAAYLKAQKSQVGVWLPV